MSICGNEIINCGLNGLYLQSIGDIVATQNFIINDNQIQSNGCYGIYIKECSGILENNTIHNNLKGGIFIKALDTPILK